MKDRKCKDRGNKIGSEKRKINIQTENEIKKEQRKNSRKSCGEEPGVKDIKHIKIAIKRKKEEEVEE